MLTTNSLNDDEEEEATCMGSIKWHVPKLFENLWLNPTHTKALETQSALSNRNRKCYSTQRVKNTQN